MAKTLAVKYRPKTWDEVVEQNSTKIILQQQIETGTFKSAYLFTGSAGTGKTTCARIFANEINKGEGNPIELDAASQNGVDDVRNIIQQAKTKSINSEYKIFILDECVTGDVEILTTDGFKRFDACDGSEIVAQYNNGNVEFVKPDGWVKNEYSGDLIKWSPRNWCSVRMTPNHVQPLYYHKSHIVREKYIKDVKFAQSNSLIVSGKGCGKKAHLTPQDRLAIVCQADATIQSVNSDYVHWSISLVKQRKIDRLLQIFESCNINWREIKVDGKKRRFTFDTPHSISKLFTTHFNLDFSYTAAREFIDEVVQWDGYVTDKYVEYMSTMETNSDFVAAVAVLGGYSVRQRIQVDNRRDAYKDIHKVFMYDTELSNCQYIGKTIEHEQYSGFVYCVKVPSHQIVVRSQGFVFITGNCHAFSNNAWQAMLKIIEEPPAKSIFIMCTTNPERIPKTILSRVQRYDFQRISQQGIVKRLQDILEKEGYEPQRTISDKSYFVDAIEYIAKLADGGCRDAITLLDKCLAYSPELTVENVVKALGVIDYGPMFKLTDALLGYNNLSVKDAVVLIDKIYDSGKDLKLFVKQYISFLIDCIKYSMKCSWLLINIPKLDEYVEILSDYQYDDYRMLRTWLERFVNLSAEIKWSQNAKADIEAMIIVYGE